MIVFLLIYVTFLLNFHKSSAKNPFLISNLIEYAFNIIEKRPSFLAPIEALFELF